LGERICAACYDPLTARWERTYGGALRRDVLARAHGRVLELGLGTGHSLPHYPAAVEELVAVEPSAPMAHRARKRAHAAGRDVTVVSAPAERLPFEAASFDTVVAMLVLCTVQDPAGALAEVRRVLKPDGTFLFMEHVRSESESLARWQDRLERPWGFVAGGCHPNRPTLAAIEAAGLRIVDVEPGDQPGVAPLVRPFIRGAAAPT
jgi:ubiquinone/menaquinone biosynthesis C-methylase UbiE